MAGRTIFLHTFWTLGHMGVASCTLAGKALSHPLQGVNDRDWSVYWVDSEAYVGGRNAFHDGTLSACNASNDPPIMLQSSHP